MRNLYIIIFTTVVASFLLFSCESNDSRELGAGGVAEADSTVFQLDRIKVLFPAVEQWEERGATQYTTDSAIIFDRNGEMLLEKNFTINIDVTRSLKIEEQFQTELTVISSDAASADLSKLDKHHSSWKELKPSVGNTYVKAAYSAEQMNQYPNVSIQAILDHIFMQTRTTKSEFDWNKYLKQAKDIYEFPFRIKMTQITLRLTGEYINGGEFEKYIVFMIG